MPGPTPINQLNALPLLTTDTFAIQGDVTIVGGSLVKKWIASQTGINNSACNVADPHGGAFAFLLTNWLDFTGTRTVTLDFAVIQNDPGGHLDEAVQWTVFVIGAAFINNVLVEPVPFPPGPDPRNLTGAYGQNAYAQAAVINIPNAGASVAGQFPFNKISTGSFDIGIVLAANKGAGAIGPARLLFLCNPGSGFQFAFLTVYAKS